MLPGLLKAMLTKEMPPPSLLRSTPVLVKVDALPPA